MKKKPVVVTIPRVETAPARALVRDAARPTPYPTAVELVSSSSEWKRWLEGAMRAVALAGAVGVAASGCSSDVMPSFGPLVGGDAAPAAPDGGDKDEPGIVMYPIAPSSPIGTGAGGGAPRPPETHPPHPTQGGGSGTVVVSPLPDPPPVDGTQVSVGDKPPVIAPTQHPPMIRGMLRPVQRPVALPGRIRPVGR